MNLSRSATFSGPSGAAVTGANALSSSLPAGTDTVFPICAEVAEVKPKKSTSKMTSRCIETSSDHLNTNSNSVALPALARLYHQRHKTRHAAAILLERRAKSGAHLALLE